MAQSLPKHIRHLVARLDEDRLSALHDLVVKRLKELSQARDQEAMANFQISNRVAFDYHGVQKVGTVVRLNQKTVSVLLDNGGRWNVSPDLLTKLPDSG